MCGIAGIVGQRGSDHRDEVRAMADSLRHRGPDAEGFYSNSESGLFLGHRRLSIIDLSDRANQPMVSEDGKIVVVFNGEIYNYVELREELQAAGHIFKTTSDTEVIIHGYTQWGTGCFGRFRGMFAIGLYDHHESTLLLVRDPLGIKPLYYYEGDEALAFSSEARGIWRHSGCMEKPDLDEDQVAKLFVHGYLPDSGGTIVQGIRKVSPGAVLTVQDGKSREEQYWTLEVKDEWAGLGMDEACDKFGELFKDTMRIMLRSDVPLSFLLSGGLDSSFVVAMAAELGAKDIRTFTAVFGHPLDEGEFARQVAGQFGATHEELHIEVGNATEEFENTIDYYDELSSLDSGLFTTSLISRKITEQGIKVAFVGEGADEILGGYSWFGLSQLPFSLMPMSLRSLGYFYATTRLASCRYWKNARRVTAAFKSSGQDDIMQQVSFYEIMKQLPNNLLQKVDRATMSASLEARVPYMDHKVVEAAYSLPAKLKRRGAWFRFGNVQEKLILRKLAERYVSPDIAWRKKRGFLLPLANMVIENRDFVRDVLTSGDSLARRFFSGPELERMLNFRNTMYHPVEKEKEWLAWRMLVLSLWHRKTFKA